MNINENVNIKKDDLTHIKLDFFCAGLLVGIGVACMIVYWI